MSCCGSNCRGSSCHEYGCRGPSRNAQGRCGNLRREARHRQVPRHGPGPYGKFRLAHRRHENRSDARRGRVNHQSGGTYRAVQCSGSRNRRQMRTANYRKSPRRTTGAVGAVGVIASRHPLCQQSGQSSASPRSPAHRCSPAQGHQVRNWLRFQVAGRQLVSCSARCRAGLRHPCRVFRHARYCGRQSDCRLARCLFPLNASPSARQRYPPMISTFTPDIMYKTPKEPSFTTALSGRCPAASYSPTRSPVQYHRR